MASRKRGRKAQQQQQQQQKLTFEPVAASSGRKKKSARQQTLEASMENSTSKKLFGQQKAMEDHDEPVPSPTSKTDSGGRQAARNRPSSHFMLKSTNGSRHVVLVSSDSETPVEEDGGVSDSDGEGPLRPETPRQARASQVVVISKDSDEDESSASDDECGEEPEANVRSSQSLPNQAAVEDDPDDDQPLATPRSSMPSRRGRQVIDIEDEDEDEDEDEEIQTPAKRRRLAKNRAAASSSKQRVSTSPTSTARGTRSRARRSHRTEKDKKLELLRRRRAGEKDLKMDDLTPSEDDDEEGALYDTDSDHQVLEVFDDESEPEVEAAANKHSKKAKKRQKATKSVPLDEDANSDDEDFIDDDDDTLGVPDEALHLIPLEFTRASRKPLKAHFRDAVEWLVHRKINPAFDRDNEVYATAWRRLSDEVTGLANSKFVSSVWRPDFYKALRARPYIVQTKVDAGPLGIEYENCQACGRSGHPATWSISFQGKAYDIRTLDEVESDSDDEDDDVDRDADGNPIPPEEEEFLVGTTCNANAETAHGLIHWKSALRDWVEMRLDTEGWLEEERILERDRMKAKKRQKLADELVDGWDENDIIKNLFMDFKTTIETARTKDTTKVARRRY
ncbi:hypothetical protein M406DRAFT_335479 [Cryphonectria parasitica EP155]|uniref:DUF4211 domain-containing protein n=1 Tax=Cryphonectria parasitica (strain ATCC 38755 / EP155) TaxID=660469 RepID=A0A9P5CTG1_CRYP1|nr:uncharacterized protein M406DRAFT_335479 [Cryphonectria parasitica EP155]KAF3769637.1 hypothetical protein M406DRAFT_335479 [Cryphonectria parasitica EP155]